MTFIDTRLPEDIERGASGGQGFSTTVTRTTSGQEFRNRRNARSLGSWDIGYGIQSKEDFSVVLAFFYNMFGKANSFRFKDHADFEIGNAGTNTPQTIGTGDTVQTVFPIVRRYTTALTFFDRILEKITALPVPRAFLDY